MEDFRSNPPRLSLSTGTDDGETIFPHWLPRVLNFFTFYLFGLLFSHPLNTSLLWAPYSELYRSVLSLEIVVFTPGTSVTSFTIVWLFRTGLTQLKPRCQEAASLLEPSRENLFPCPFSASRQPPSLACSPFLPSSKMLSLPHAAVS